MYFTLRIVFSPIISEITDLKLNHSEAVAKFDRIRSNWILHIMYTG